MANEVQDIYWDVLFTAVEAGDFVLSHSGNDTSTIAAGASAATVQSELQGLASIGSGNVSVSKLTDRWRVTFQGSLANTDVAEISITSQSGKGKADTITVANVQSGAANPDASLTYTKAVTSAVTAVSAVGEVQTISFSATPDAGNLILNGNTLNQLGYGSIGETNVQYMLRTVLGGSTMVTVLGTPLTGPFTATWPSGEGAISDTILDFSSSDLTSGGDPVTVTVTIDTQGVTAVTPVSQVDKLEIDHAPPVEGQFQFAQSIGGSTLDFTALNYDVDAAGLQTKLNNSIGAGFSVTGNWAGGFFITWPDSNNHLVTGDTLGYVLIYSQALKYAGQPQIKSYYLADSPDSGKYNANIDGVDYLLDYNADASAVATATGWGTTGSNTSGDPFVMTAPTNAADVTVTAAEDAGNPLRKAVTLSVETVTEGGGVAPDAAPSGPSATALSSSSIRVAWTDNSSNETGFKVQQSANGTTGWSTIHTTSANATSYDVTGLSTATTYYFKVCATNATGDSSFTSVVNATTDDVAPTAPSSPSATTLSSSSIRVAWTDNSSNETSLRVEVSADGSTGWTTAGTAAANATSKDITGLTPGTTYYFRVFAVNGAGDSSATSTVDATTTAETSNVARQHQLLLP